MSLPIEVIEIIHSFCDLETKRDFCALNKECLDYFLKKSLHSLAAITMNDKVDRFNLFQAFRRQCYICGETYEGSFNSVFNVYAHIKCVQKRCAMISMDDYIFTKISQFIPFRRFGYVWRTKMDYDNIPIEETLNFWKSINKKRKRPPSPEVCGKTKKFYTEYTRYDKKLDGLNKRVQTLKKFCIEKLHMDEKQYLTTLRLLLNTNEGDVGDYFHIRCNSHSSLRRLYYCNKSIFDAVLGKIQKTFTNRISRNKVTLLKANYNHYTLMSEKYVMFH